MLYRSCCLPSFMAPCASIACPTGNTVFTKIPMDPFGESIPPTTLNPNPFLPGPFSNSVVCNDMDNDFGRWADELFIPLGFERSDGIILRPIGFVGGIDATCCCCLRSTPLRVVEWDELVEEFPPGTRWCTFCDIDDGSRGVGVVGMLCAWWGSVPDCSPMVASAELDLGFLEDNVPFMPLLLWLRPPVPPLSGQRTYILL